MLESKFASSKAFKNINIVLVFPKIAENIGLTARVLKNTSFLNNLSLVNPCLSSKSFEVAKKARDVLEKAKIFHSLKDALSSSHFIIGATRRKREFNFIYNFDYIKPAVVAYALSGKVSILFGREDFGLSKEDLSLCDGVFYIPANEDFPSYNLSFSVCIVCYELFNFIQNVCLSGNIKPARKKDIDSLLKYIEGYLRKGTEAGRVNNYIATLRRIASKTILSKNEVSLLKSLIINNKKGR